MGFYHIYKKNLMPVNCSKIIFYYIKNYQAE